MEQSWPNQPSPSYNQTECTEAYMMTTRVISQAAHQPCASVMQHAELCKETVWPIPLISHQHMPGWLSQQVQAVDQRKYEVSHGVMAALPDGD